MNDKMSSISIIKLAPVLVEKIWGGTWLKEQFGYKSKSNNIGESWVISAHPSGDCKVLNGFYKGKTLSQLYNLRRDLFANDAHEKFPLLVKLIDAKEDLSVQVHPNNEYAQKHEGQSGKSEAWIILNAESNARILVGHNARTHHELQQLVNEQKWRDLLNYRKLVKGEIIYIPSGTLHAICAGTSLIEIQQSSDVTYRLYDYDRIDDEGKKRELHLEKSLDVIDVPAKKQKQIFMPENFDYNHLNKVLQTPYFRINSLIVYDDYIFTNPEHKYYLIAVLNGEGKIGRLKATKGNSFILTSNSKKIQFQGDMHLIISTL
ncbi:MAG: type I phosphomannose isomerase catalytic subunit [Bacilli bacterium]|jgi:mannose-6-phosphate isomerase|nr:class I mannose-6-phosphate isomerase [Bacilli bacterium]